MTIFTHYKLRQIAAAVGIVVSTAFTYGASADAGETDEPWNAPVWDAAVAYNPSDMVVQSSTKYWAIKKTTAGTAVTDAAFWTPIVQTYFIDAAGGLDTYNGLSKYAGYLTNTDGSQGTANAAYGPWQTLSAVQEKVCVGYWDTASGTPGPGNNNTYPLNHTPWVAALSGSVFLFKRGTAYAGQIQINVTYPTSHGDFFFGAYGAGARPQINHDNMTTRYSLNRGVLWVNQPNVKVRNLALDGLYGVSDPGNSLHPKTAGITSGATNFAFVNASMSRSGGDGLAITANVSTYTYVKNSTVSYCGLGGHPGNGVAGGATGALLENLTVNNCGIDTLLTHGVYLATWDESTVRRCDIYGSANFGINSGAYGANPLIEQNYIHDNLNGIDMGSSNYALAEQYTGIMRIRGNIIANNGVTAGTNGNAIYTINCCPAAYITNNLFYGNYGDVITVHQPVTVDNAVTSNIHIWNNTISSTRPVRLIRFMNDLQTCSVRNNILHGTSSGVDGFMQDTGLSLLQMTLTNNLYHFPNKANPLNVANTLGTQRTLAYMQGLGYESGSITGDPLFTNFGAQDFTLQSGSPAKLAGFNSGITTDFASAARNATTPSIGAYE